MILVADSGSSSSEWMLHLPDSDPLSFRTKGLNPYFVSEKEIARVLGEVPEIILIYRRCMKFIFLVQVVLRLIGEKSSLMHCPPFFRMLLLL